MKIGNITTAIATHEKCIGILELMQTVERSRLEARSKFARMSALPKNEVWYKYPFYSEADTLADIAKYNAILDRLRSYYANQFK